MGDLETLALVVVGAFVLGSVILFGPLGFAYGIYWIIKGRGPRS